MIMINTVLLEGIKTKCRDLHKAGALFLSPTGVVVHLGVCSVQTGCPGGQVPLMVYVTGVTLIPEAGHRGLFNAWGLRAPTQNAL